MSPHSSLLKLSLVGVISVVSLLGSGLVPGLSTGAEPIVQQAYLKASNTDAGDQFSFWSVALFGDTLVVGAPGEASNATGVNGDQMDNGGGNPGAAYVFVRQGTNWSQQAYLKASHFGANSFGWSVSISGDTIVVGAPSESNNATGVNGNQTNGNLTWSGAAYVFVRTGTNWTQQTYLKASNPGSSDNFGESVSVSGDIIVVGAPSEDSNATGVNGNQTNNSASGAGAAYVFVRDSTNWSQQAYLKASNTGRSDEFGCSVAVAGDTVVVGARFEDSNAVGVNGDQANDSASGSGAAYVFVRDGTNWSQQAYLKASNTEGGDFFGYRTAISGDTIVVSADFEPSSATGVNGDQSDNSAPYAGAAYVFVRSGTNWSPQAYLKASNTAANNYFGDSVAVSGDVIVVAASVEFSSATGVNGDQSDTNAVGSGAAYVFVRQGTNWTQQAYLKASNTEKNDAFGRSATVSGDTVVVGAYQEDSKATGVNGDQGDNTAPNAGATYVFVSLGVGNEIAITQAGSGGYSVSFKGVPEFTYRLERAASVAGPWTALDAKAAPPSGLIEFHDPSPLADQGFYRVARQ